MPDIILTEQEVQTLLRCLNDRVGRRVSGTEFVKAADP